MKNINKKLVYEMRYIESITVNNIKNLWYK